MATTLPSASNLFDGAVTFFDLSGLPLVDGTVAFYTPGTTVLQPIWTDIFMTAASPNPVTLDATGSCTVYGAGQYRQLVLNQNGDQMSDTIVVANTPLIVNQAMLPVLEASTVAQASALLSAVAPIATYQDPAPGSAIETVSSRLTNMMLLMTDFNNVDPSGNAFSDIGFNLFWSAVISTGRPGFIPPGHYKFQNPSIMMWNTTGTGAARITGVTGRSILDFTAVSTAPALTISGNAGGLFYGTFSGITVLANSPGAAVQIGLPDQTVAFNGYKFGLQISNANATAAAIGLSVWGAFNCDINVTANCNGQGDALQSNYMAFCNITGSFGHATNGVHLANFYSFGNVFSAIDIEVVNLCVLIDSIHAATNTFIGGQFVWTNGTGTPIAGINATTGGNNSFIGVNFASGVPIATGVIGILIQNSGIGVPVTGGLDVLPAGSFDANITLDCATPQSSTIIFRRASLARWRLAVNNATESGGNVGSDFLITRFNDAGQSIDNPIYFTRSTGQTNIINLIAGAGGGTLSFFGSASNTQPTVSGSRSNGDALTSLIGALSQLGLIHDATSP